MNKYQSAINELKYALVEDDKQLTWSLEEKRKIVDTLQELVDIASKPTIIYGDETTCVVNLDRIDQLEKALDKACEFLEDGYGNELADYTDYISLDKKIQLPYSMSSKQWKEWLLKDE